MREGVGRVFGLGVQLQAHTRTPVPDDDTRPGGNPIPEPGDLDGSVLALRQLQKGTAMGVAGHDRASRLRHDGYPLTAPTERIRVRHDLFAYPAGRRQPVGRDTGPVILSLSFGMCR